MAEISGNGENPCIFMGASLKKTTVFFQHFEALTKQIPPLKKGRNIR